MSEKKSLEQLLYDLLESMHEDKLVLGATQDGRPHDPDPEIDRLRKEILSTYGQPAATAGWVKATDRLPGYEKRVNWEFHGLKRNASLFEMLNSFGHRVGDFEWLDEANEQPVEQKENDAVGKFLEWVYENGITRHSNGHWYKWDNGNAKEKYYANDNQHICELYQNKQ